MMVELGHLAVTTALVVALLGGVAPWIGIRRGEAAWVQVGRQAITACFALLSLGCAALIGAFLARDFSVKYVFEHSNTRLPIFYTITALWGGHEGSLLFWAWILAGFATLATWQYWRRHPAMVGYLISVESLVLVGFLSLILFLSSPFERLFPPPQEGLDLNPLLQDPGMVFHPPFLYMGYVGFSIPYAFAMAALLSGRLGEEWIRATHRWTLFAWMMLTLGILMGAYWAYYELGWGGYWAWDPVENASFMPWLVGTAFLHSVMVQERRKMFKVWNLFLVILTFTLSLLGTFLVRSGVLSSVHAFANDPGRGLYLLLLISLVLITSFGLLIFRSEHLKSPVQIESLLSRESLFLFNNLFFLVGTATVLLGTLYPLAVEALTGTKVTVGPPYFNKVFLPIALGILFLMGVGPSIPWRRASGESLRRHFLVPFLVTVFGLGVGYPLGIRPVYPMAAVGIILFVGTTILQDYLRTTAYWRRRSGRGWFQGALLAIRHHRRRYGGLLVHLGVLFLMLGVLGSSVYREEKTLLLRPGDTFQLHRYQVEFVGLREVQGTNWTGVEGIFRVWDGPRLVVTLHPQKRSYPRSQMPTTEAAIHPVGTNDLYVSMGDLHEDGSVSVLAFYHPLVRWMWYGGGVMAAGVLLILLNRRRRE